MELYTYISEMVRRERKFSLWKCKEKSLQIMLKMSPLYTAATLIPGEDMQIGSYHGICWT